MSFFPSFSNIDISIKETLDKRKGNPLEVSKLNVWVKLTSAVGNGLILYSNPDYKLFNAAGDGNISTIYGSNSQSGVLGVDWNDNPVRATNSDLPLQPRPVVTSIEIDEGAGNISRKATISITAFTKGQAELVSEYFLEPGFTVFFEFGWNTPKSVGQIVKTGANSIARMQSMKELFGKRTKSNGTYENYLGYITGGNISLEGTLWNITVNLTGFTEIPLYLKTHENIRAEDFDKTVEETAASLRYDPPIESEEDGVRLFKMMFNDLPPIRQTESVKKLEERLSKEYNFINFDEKVRGGVNNKTDGTLITRAASTVGIRSFLGLVSFDSDEKVQGETVNFPAGTKLVGDERFIRFGAMMEIMQASIVSGSIKLGDRSISIKINSNDTVISAFPNMFSLDKSKLFIPNPKTPKFSLAATANATGSLNSIISQNETTDNSIETVREQNNRGTTYDRIKFPAQTEYNSDTNSKAKDADYWGYLDNLYINFDFFKNVISTPNFDIRNALYTILNGLSSAAGNMWDFQIVQSESIFDSNNISLTIVDINFTEKTSQTDIYEFDLMGEQSIFMSNTFEMDISGQMMNHIIGKRIGLSQPDPVDTGKSGKGLFSDDKKDKILSKIQKVDLDTTPYASKETTETPSEQEIKDKNLQLFLDTVGMYPRVNNAKKVTGGDLETLLYFATCTDKTLFDKQRNATKISNTKAKEEYSILLPIKFSFKIHGISGIKRGDKFKVSGLPEQYSRNGFFQVTAVKHTVSGMKWETDVEGSYRNSLSS
jgi:hypothetical protein